MTSPLARYLALIEHRKAASKALAEAVRIVSSQVADPKLALTLRRQAKRIETCAVSQYVRAIREADGTSRVHHLNKRRCDTRFCKSCANVRSKQQAAKISALLDCVWEFAPTMQPLFVTTTTKNRPFTGADTAAMLDDHDKALRRMWKMPRILHATIGSYTTFETVVRKKVDPRTGATALFAGLHAHSFVLVSSERYFRREIYLTQREWQRCFREAARLSYAPIVDVRALKDAAGEVSPAATRGGIREATKYLAHGFLDIDANGDVSVEPSTAAILIAAFYRRRSHRYERAMAKAAKILRERAKAQAATPSGANTPDLPEEQIHEAQP